MLKNSTWTLYYVILCWMYLGMLIEHLRNTLYSSPFLILRITGNGMTRDLVICCLLKPTYKTHHFTTIYWQTRGEVLKSTHIPDGSSLHWLLDCMNRSLAIFSNKFLGEFGPSFKLNIVSFFCKQPKLGSLLSSPE